VLTRFIRVIQKYFFVGRSLKDGARRRESGSRAFSAEKDL
jgi:hypothetical protein